MPVDIYNSAGEKITETTVNSAVWTASAGDCTAVAMDTATARIGVGLQLVKMGRYSLRAEYNGAFSKHTSVNAGDIALHATF